jgi:hypothetical protein
MALSEHRQSIQQTFLESYQEDKQFRIETILTLCPALQ